MRALDMLFGPFVSLPFEDEAARHYGEIRHRLEVQSVVIGPNDLKIAAIARAHDLTIVTSNVDEFARVPDLKTENWER